jgi:hypothetical protein
MKPSGPQDLDCRPSIRPPRGRRVELWLKKPSPMNVPVVVRIAMTRPPPRRTVPITLAGGLDFVEILQPFHNDLALGINRTD